MERQSQKKKQIDMKLDREWRDPDLTDKYELLEFLGEGTYGQVIRAKCKTTG